MFAYTKRHLMKRVLQFTLGVLAISTALQFQSCDKIKDSVKPTDDFDFTGAGADITIPATNDTTAQGSIGQVTLNYDLDSMIKAKSKGLLSYNDIETIKITSVTLTLTDGSKDNNFANFEYAGVEFNSDIYMAASPNVDPYTVAYIEHNPDNYNTTLSPPVTDSGKDVKKYFGPKMQFDYYVVGKLRRPITTPLHGHFDITYLISPKKS